MSTANISPTYRYLSPGALHYPVPKMDYIRALSAAFWIVSLTFSFWQMGTYYDRIAESTQEATTFYAAIGFGVALVAHLTLGIHRLTSTPFLPPYQDVSKAMFSIFCIIMLVLAPRSLFPLYSAGYALLTLGTLCLVSWIWQNDYRAIKLMLYVAAALLLLVLLLVFIKHGFNRGSIGGINRNRYAYTALAAVICCFFGNKKVKWIGLLAGVPFMLMVNSRGSILSLCVFLSVYYCVSLGFRKFFPWAVLMALLGMTVILVGRGDGLNKDLILNRIFKIDSEDRGIGSGFSGRSERWKEGWEGFQKNPLVGYGFRTRRNLSIESKSAHSGYINLLLDAGLVGFFLVVGGFAIDFFARLFSVRRLRYKLKNQAIPNTLLDSYNVNCVTCAIYVTVALHWVFEPNYLNLGTPWVMLFFLLITSPRLTESEFYRQLNYFPLNSRLQRAY